MPPPLPPTPDQVIVRKDYDPKGEFRFSASCFSDLCLFPGWGLVIRHWESLCRGPHSRAWDLVVCGALAQRTGPGKACYCVGSAGMKQHCLNPGCHPGSHSAISVAFQLPSLCLQPPLPMSILCPPLPGRRSLPARCRSTCALGFSTPVGWSSGIAPSVRSRAMTRCTRQVRWGVPHSDHTPPLTQP